MIRTIKQRIYVVGLLPLATLAVALVVLNGFARIDEANREVENAQNVTAALLESPAVDALIVGNTLNFEQAVSNVIKTSPLLVCIILRDADRRTVAQVGQCDRALPQVNYFPITASSGGFSDFKEPSGVTSPIGELGVVMNDESVVRKRRQVVFQLTLSLLMIAVVLGFIARLLRARLIEPIRRIGSAMHALSQRDYNARVSIEGEDELTRLAAAINQTIGTISAYTRELERRRSDADRALQDADEANLVRGGLVRALTEDLEGPMSLMHSELAAIAVANKDPALRDRIKAVIALLQKAQTDFDDLMEVAAGPQEIRQPPPRDLEDILSDIERDVRLLSEVEGVPIKFALTNMPSGHLHRGEPAGIFLDVDAVRLKKALVYLIRSMGRRCKESGVYVSAEFLPISAEQLHVSVHLKAFYDPIPGLAAVPWHARLSRYKDIPAIVGWTDRETKIIDYLLRAVGIEPNVNASPMGDVSILLGITCHYDTAEPTVHRTPTDWMFATHPISTTLVSNDLSLMRLTTRGDITNLEVKLVSFSRALANPSMLCTEAALLIDMSDDIADVIRLLNQIKAEAKAVPYLIAICPPGRVSDSLAERLLELGFTGIIQKPLHYSRLIEVIRTTFSHPLMAINPDSHGDQSGES